MNPSGFYVDPTCFPTNVNNSKIVPKHLNGNLVFEGNISKMAGGDYNGITKECDEGFYYI